MNALPGLASIVIVNWNGMAFIRDCIQSVHAQSYSPCEIIVVDNGSTDGSREWLRANALSGYRLIEFDVNTGFARGVNTGIRAASGEYIALLNNDAVADHRWLEYLIRSVRNSEFGMAASKILFHDRPDVIDKAGHLFYPDGLNRGRGAGEVDRGQFDGMPEILFPDGCAALYLRRMLDDVGLFDEQFFAYGDDADLGLRARWRGWRCAYAPAARVYHRHSSSLGKYSPVKAFLVERNRLWVAVKLLPWPVLLASPFLTLWRFLWHAWSLIRRRGLAGGVAREHSAARLLGALVRAYASGLLGIIPILRKRREVFRTRRIGTLEFLGLIRKYRISARELAVRD
ncbi:MAG: glycosyltransferase family 2 protein [Acidobacteria bacterium]|nr:glycosyltransferase family 2 protein [Acidobacteriota bacterium]